MWLENLWEPEIQLLFLMSFSILFYWRNLESCFKLQFASFCSVTTDFPVKIIENYLKPTIVPLLSIIIFQKIFFNKYWPFLVSLAIQLVKRLLVFLVRKGIHYLLHVKNLLEVYVGSRKFWLSKIFLYSLLFMRSQANDVWCEYYKV